MASESELNAGIEDGVRRRDFINIAAVSFAGVGAVAVVLPLVNQMNPSADVLALSTTEIDISAIQPGQAIKTSWRKQPVFVRNLVAKEIAEGKMKASDFPDFAKESGIRAASYTKFIDGGPFDANKPNAYIDSFKIGLKGKDSPK